MRRFVSVIFLSIVCCAVKRPVAHQSDATVASPPPNDAPLQEVIVEDNVKLVPASRHVLIVGDSEACAVRPYVKETVKKVNEAAGMPLDVIDVACKGGTVVQYWGEQGHFREALRANPKPDAVLVFLGTNHYWQSTTPPVDQVLDIVKEHGIDCVWIGNTAVKGKHWRVNNLLRTAVQPTCSYFDTEAAEIPLPDGVHPSGAGAIKWLKAIWPMIPPKYEEHHE